MRAKWTRNEILAIEGLAGDVPPVKITEYYNKWAKKNGYPERTYWAISSLMVRNGISRKAEGEWVTSRYISKTLGVSIDIPQRWAEKERIKCYHNGSRRSPRFYKRSDILRLAREQPELFGGIPADRLFILLEDYELCETIVKTYPYKKSSGRAVIAVESGMMYPSVCAAARAVSVCPQSISFALRRGGTSAGYHWKHVQ